MNVIITSKCYSKVLMQTMGPISQYLPACRSIITSSLSQTRSVWIPKASRLCKRHQETRILSRNLVKKNHLPDLFYSTGKVGVRFDLHKKLPRDILVYSHKNDQFYLFLSYFGVFQMFIWGYVALFSFQQLKSIPSEMKDTTDLPWWKRLMYKEGQYKNALTAICLIVGMTVMFITLTYPRRAVRNLWLLRGGDKVKITTYSWMGRTNTFQKPVDHLSFTASRTGSGNYVPLKIKDSSFFYLLDKQGTFHNKELFDFTVGLKRTL